MMLTDGFVAFDPVTVEPGADGPLAGKTFAVKDAIDVAGCVTGNGHPLWRSTHPAAEQSAWCVTQLLAAGAQLTGKTHTDELTYSLAGQNAHYGTLPNPADQTRIPGGSSSGSASVVAAGHVDFALGTDCGGSVRIPSSYCGLFGLRPTHGVLPMQGVCTLAPSFDTVGWFASEASTLQAVGAVLFDGSAASVQSPLPTTFRRVSEAFDGLDASSAEAALRAIDRSIGVLVERQPAITLAALDCDLERLARVFRTVQGFEAWQALGSWIETYKPRFGPGVAERFAAAAAVTQEEFEAASRERQWLRHTLRSLVTPDCLLCLPTAPGPALSLDAAEPDIDHCRQLTLAITAIAGIAGLPQITMPLSRVDNAPIGLSLIGPLNSDLALLDVACRISSQ
ncbi:MAG: amidase [Salinisphaera sp.]|jgi:amidase|nr:amidase [Salinisphaera sp.]